MAVVIPLIPDVPFPLILAVFLGSLSALFFLRSRPAKGPAPSPTAVDNTKQSTATTKTTADPSKMTASDSVPPLTMTPTELAKFNNADPGLPVYVAIKGVIFDVSSNREMYPLDQGYGQFAGKDASRALAKSSLDKAHCVPEWEDLPEEEIKVLNDWVAFYEKKYPKVGRVVAE